MNKIKIISLLTLIIFVLSFFGSSPIPVHAITWWNTDWDYKIKIIIDADKIDEDLTDFPILVYLDVTNINWLHCQDDIDDLRFLDSTQTILLKAELENYTDGEMADREAWIWVKIPFISADNDTYFYLYYGNNDVPSYWNPEDVWDSSTKMVQHMKDNPDNSHIKDSTSYNNDGIKKGINEPMETDYWLDGTQTFDGIDDYINCGNNEYLGFTVGNFTISFIICFYNTSINSIPFSKGYWCTDGYYIYYNVGGYLNFVVNKAGEVGGQISISFIDSLEWYNIVIIRNGINVKIYSNGEDVTSGHIDIFNPDFSTRNLYLGQFDDGGWKFEGTIEEIKIYNEIKSSSWIKANYYSCFDDLLFYEEEEYVPYTLIVRYNFGINKLYVNNTLISNSTIVYIFKDTNVNVTAISKTNFIFEKHLLGLTVASMTPTFIFNMTAPNTIWSYALSDVALEPTTFTFTHWMILLFLALIISLISAIKFHIIGSVSLILTVYMIINYISFSSMILLAIIVWILTLLFSILALLEIKS